MRRVIIGGLVGLTLCQPGWAGVVIERFSHISAEHDAHCEKYAQAVSNIAKDDYINVITRAYGECISVLPFLLEIPKEPGTVPATENPKEEEWRRQCRAEYNTWDEETGTVIRRGNPERVRCPCMGEVVCVY